MGNSLRITDHRHRARLLNHLELVSPNLKVRAHVHCPRHVHVSYNGHRRLAPRAGKLDDVCVGTDADVVVGEPHRLHVHVVIRPARDGDVPVGA